VDGSLARTVAIRLADAHQLLGRIRVLTFPRILGALSLFWGCAVLAEGVVTSTSIWILWAWVWIVTGAALVSGRYVVVALGLAVVACLLEAFLRSQQMSGLELMAWLALLTAVSENRPEERALLVRFCATIVYTFAAVTKLNPSWLAGEGITGLIRRQPQLAPLGFIADNLVLALVIAVGVIALEAGLAIGLWVPRLRRTATVIGAVMHVTFVFAAASDVWGGIHLALFNGALLATYLAFWSPALPLRSLYESARGRRSTGVDSTIPT